MLLKVENTLTLIDEGEHLKELPLGVYKIKYSEMRQMFYLEKTKDIVLPDNIFGEKVNINKWLTNWRSSYKNMGILLTGLKGTGKTITASKIAIESKRPVMLIEDDVFFNSKILSFLNRPEFKSCVVMIDELEKIVNKEDSPILLRALDGSEHNNLLFVMTSNNARGFTYLINRPGRVRYSKKYSRLSQEEVMETCTHLLNDKSAILEIVKQTNLITELNYDILLSIIKDKNMFPEESIESIIKDLHIKIEEITVVSEMLDKEGNHITDFTKAYFDPRDPQLNLAFYASQLDDVEDYLAENKDKPTPKYLEEILAERKRNSENKDFRNRILLRIRPDNSTVQATLNGFMITYKDVYIKLTPFGY